MSEWCQIENNFFTIQVTSRGAEMKRLFFHSWNQELLWSGEDKIWERSAPVLFPFVGKLKNNEFIYKQKTYHMNQHGFARDMEFEFTKTDLEECELILKESNETLKNYPFHFELRTNYKLEGAKVHITYTVKNTDSSDIYFSLGAHPGFATPNIHDYDLAFEKNEEAYFLTDEGLLNLDDHVNFKIKDLNLDAELFKKGALVFKHLKSSHIDLVDKINQRIIRLEGTQVPFLGIWGKEHVPFVCIEPWYGVADITSHDQQLENKEGIIKLAPAKEFIFTYSIGALHK